MTFHVFSITKEGFDDLFKAYDADELKKNDPEAFIGILENSDSAMRLFQETQDGEACREGYTIRRNSETYELEYEGHYDDQSDTHNPFKKIGTWFDSYKEYPWVFYERGENMLEAQTEEELNQMIEERQQPQPLQQPEV